MIRVFMIFSWLFIHTAQAFSLHPAGKIPVLHEGRVKPLDTAARTFLLLIHEKQTLNLDGRKLDAIEWLLDTATRFEKASRYPVFRIDHPQIRAMIAKEESGQKYFSFTQLAPYLEEIRQLADQEGERDSFDEAALKLWNKLALYLRLIHNLAPPETASFAQELDYYKLAIKLADSEPDNALLLDWFTDRYELMARSTLIAPLFPSDVNAPFSGVGEALLKHPGHPDLSFFAKLYDTYRNGGTYDREIEAYLAKTASKQPGLIRKIRLEMFFNEAQPFFLCMLLYIAAFLLVMLFWLTERPVWQKSAACLLLFTLFLHTAGLAIRMILEGRPPVTNLYSSAIFVGWGAVILGLLLEAFYRNGLGAATASLIGGSTLIIAQHLASKGDTMEMMRAVLNSNFWLSTHVVTITIGYSATLLAGFLGALAIIRRLIQPKRKERESESMIYSIICFSLFFSFVGTILGGLWADQSWGRFWGWDPKENGALLIVLWNAVILHARWGGMAKGLRLSMMAVFGTIVTAFSWFGVNMLGVGLHSYGFTDQAYFWLALFAAVQMGLIGIGGALQWKAR